VKFSRRMGRVYPRAIQMVQSGLVQLDSLVTHRFPLERAPDAFAFQGRYHEGVLKTVITID
jgi:L-iditol 2-dehydrogenase